MMLGGYTSSLLRKIFKIWPRRLKGFRREFGVCLFSKQERYFPVLKFLSLRSYSTDGLPLHMSQNCIIPPGLRLLYIRNRHKKPPWPGDFKRLMHVIHSGLKTEYILIWSYYRESMSGESVRRQVIFTLDIGNALLQYLKVLSCTVKETFSSFEINICKNGWRSDIFKKIRSLHMLLRQNILIMLSPTSGVFGTDRYVTDGSLPMIFPKKKNIYSQELRIKRKI
ncbi:hypothetical protein Bca52824_031460 [Brassica carinata]|uniref:Uncharacterized protein n=1 Tax=Brassica carinata TaxID=52824 RepID=A0A8X7S945_BRACI|nr:hypothetical protein Bca52824_031460 [Brassica carinata]